MIERYPLDKAAQAYDRMGSGQARFRVVLTIGGHTLPGTDPRIHALRDLLRLKQLK